MIKLGIEPIKQQAWHLQVKDKVKISKRPIDKMSIAEIYDMYENKKFLCDECGSSLGKIDFSLKDHILHMINPKQIWCCEDCVIKNMKSENFIGMVETKENNYQLNNI